MSWDDYSRSPTSPWGRNAFGRQGACGQWRPFEVAAVVIGFFVFWPLGLGLLLMKLWGRGFGHEGDLFSFASEQGAKLRDAFSDAAPGASPGPSMRPTGNSVFDDWRAGELDRLEKERRKLAEAERDFAEHIAELRRAKDKEEFDSFMRARKGPAA